MEALIAFSRSGEISHCSSRHREKTWLPLISYHLKDLWASYVMEKCFISPRICRICDGGDWIQIIMVFGHVSETVLWKTWISVKQFNRGPCQIGIIFLQLLMTLSYSVTSTACNSLGTRCECLRNLYIIYENWKEKIKNRNSLCGCCDILSCWWKVL